MRFCREYLTVILCFLFFSCGFVPFEAIAKKADNISLISFDALQLEIEMPKTGVSEALRVQFSFAPDCYFFENAVSFSIGKKAIDFDIVWNTDSQPVYCDISPCDGWKKGSEYSFLINGKIPTVSDGDFFVYESRHFVYGEKDGLLRLLSCSIENNAVVSENKALKFVFNKKVNAASFLEHFSLSPYCETKTEFTENEVCVTPLENWKKNQIFSWSFSEVISEDGFLCDRNYSGKFASEKDAELPCVSKISLVKADGLSFFETGVHILDFSSVYEIKSGVGVLVCFSKPMDEKSTLGNLSFSPGIKGTWQAVKGSDGTQFVFLPSAALTNKKAYTLNIENSAQDISGIPLFSSVQVNFLSADDALKINGIWQESFFTGEENTLIYDGNSSVPVREVTLFSESEPKATFLIEFSTSIMQDLLKKCEDAISFRLLFPMNANFLSVDKIKWNQTYSVASFSVSGFSAGTEEFPVFYQIFINGGSRGIVNSLGEYLEDDLCVTFSTKL